MFRKNISTKLVKLMQRCFHETVYISFAHTHTHTHRITSVNRCGCFRAFYQCLWCFCEYVYIAFVFHNCLHETIKYILILSYTKLFRVIGLYDVSLNMCTLHLYFIKVYTRHLSMSLSHLTLNRSELIFRYLFSRNVTYVKRRALNLAFIRQTISCIPVLECVTSEMKLA